MISMTRGDLAAGLGDAVAFTGTDPTLIQLCSVHISVEDGRNGVLFTATDRYVLAERMVPAVVNIPHDDVVCDDPECGIARTAATLIPLDQVKGILRDWKSASGPVRRALRGYCDGTLSITVATDGVTISGYQNADNRLDIVTTMYDCQDPNLFRWWGPRFLGGGPCNPGAEFAIDPRKLAKFATTTFGKDPSAVVRMSFGENRLRVFLEGTFHDPMDTFRGCVMLKRMAGE